MFMFMCIYMYVCVCLQERGVGSSRTRVFIEKVVQMNFRLTRSDIKK